MLQVETIEKTKAGGSRLSLSKLFLADLAGTERTLGVKGTCC